ncbi:TetR/AcrR family transcriptional regulator [Variovorax sp. GT1P44]|uniref:TetR/AcrR family transcriptional regulator n=1 Tax=Variovorax sp. GT1P44 TaxID=3443742 RepID=UPI003F48761C
MTSARRRIHAAALKLFTETGATRVNISELAAAADMARGTVYANVTDPDRLFEEVAAELVQEMAERLAPGFAGLDDPARRMSIGLRQYLRRAHEDPMWGRFMVRFGLSLMTLQAVEASDPAIDLRAGIASGRFKIDSEQMPAMLSMISGSTLAAMIPVLAGHSTWRSIGSDTVEFVLTALGVSRREAKSLSRFDLPPLGDAR